MGSCDIAQEPWKIPANVGRRLLTSVIDEKATTDPRAVWCSLPYDDSNLGRGYEDITYVKFANAINQMAWFIHDKLGPSDHFETMAYMGMPDIRYHILQMAAAKTGYKVLFSSHMNSLAGHLSLMERTNATILLAASQVKVDDIIAARPMKYQTIPELDSILAADPIERYPYNKTFEEAKNDPYLVLHTSGSTGLPKPITYTHGSLAAIDHQQSVSDVDPESGLSVRRFLTASRTPSRMLIPFLHFHAICCTAAMAGMVYGKLIYVPGFRHRMVTANDVFPILEHSNAQEAFFSPSMIEDFARRPEVGKYLSRLDRCLYGGAPVTEYAGRVVSKFTNLQNQWGTTETIKLVDFDIDPADFAYCGFNLKQSGMTFEPKGDGLYEMVVQRTEDSYLNAAFFWLFPDEQYYRPGDLWSPHPDPKKAAYLWRYEGRTDDMICWKDGINLNPAYFESKHSEHNLIKSALIAGTGHRQAVLLVETYPEGSNDEAATIDKIWTESIMPLNDVAPTNGRISMTHIIVASADKPFERSVKGTVARKATLKKYDMEIEAIYQRYGDTTMSLDGRLRED